MFLNYEEDVIKEMNSFFLISQDWIQGIQLPVSLGLFVIAVLAYRRTRQQ